MGAAKGRLALGIWCKYRKIKGGYRDIVENKNRERNI
jgi:hypothetical protein